MKFGRQHGESLRRVFTEDVLDRLGKVSRQFFERDRAGAPIRERHIILRGGERALSACHRPHRHAWVSYLQAADACGLLDSADVRARLVGNDDDGFRSAMAECFTAWYFARRRNASVTLNPSTKAAKNFDLIIERAGLTVQAEVKAPHVPVVNRTWSADDSQVLWRAVSDAGKQLKADRPNIVVIVPLLRVPVCQDRTQLLKAVIAEPVLNVFVSRDETPPPPPEPGLLQRGKLAKLWPDKDSGTPRTHLTRVSAVITLETPRTTRAGRLQTAVVVIHNPFVNDRGDPENSDRGGLRWT